MAKRVCLRCRNEIGKKELFCSLACAVWNGVKRGRKSECWEWQGTTVYGYGQFSFKQKRYRANRAAYEAHYGVDPGDMFVCHRCDNPTCCNPHHLFLGTVEDNTADMVAKGRSARGWRHNKTKLDIEDVRYIRKAHESGASLARRYGVSGAAISSIKAGKNWGHTK